MKRLLLLFSLCLFVNVYSQIIEHDWTQKVYCGGGNHYTFTSGISVTDLGYVYYVYSFLDFTLDGALPGPGQIDSYGSEDIVISKKSNTQNPMWVKHLGGPGSDIPNAVQELSNGDIIVTGIFSDSVDFDPGNGADWRVSAGEVDNFILRLDKNGNYVNCVTFGGAGYSYLNDLLITDNDEIFVSGWYNDTMSLIPNSQQELHITEGEYESFISKFDSDLNYQSSAHFAGDCVIGDICLSQESTILYSGHFEDSLTTSFSGVSQIFSSQGKRDVFYGECNLDFIGISQKTIGSENDELGWSISQLSNGTKVLQMNFEESFDIQNGAETVQISKGNSHAISNPEWNNTLLLCFTDETIEWYKVFYASHNARVFPQTELVADGSGNLIASYYFSGRCYLNDTNTTLVMENSNRGSFLVKIDPQGDFRWVRLLNNFGPSSVQITELELKENYLYAGGQFSGDVDFDLSVQTFTHYGWKDPYVTKWMLHDQFLSSEIESPRTNESFYPNPANDFLILRNPKLTDVNIHDLTGEKVKLDYVHTGEGFNINTSQLQNGVYILSYIQNNTFHSQRFVVQH